MPGGSSVIPEVGRYFFLHFFPPIRICSGFSRRSPCRSKNRYTWILDYDGDGDKDIVSGNGGRIEVKKNLGTGFFVSEFYFYYGVWGLAQQTFALDRSRYH